MADQKEYGFDFFKTAEGFNPTRAAKSAHAAIMDIFAAMSMPPAREWHTSIYKGDVLHRYIRKHGPNDTFLELEVGYAPIEGTYKASFVMVLSWKSLVADNSVTLFCHDASGNWSAHIKQTKDWRRTPNRFRAWQRRWLSVTNNWQPPRCRNPEQHSTKMREMIAELLDIYLINNAP